jgi:hypothetical protein
MKKESKSIFFILQKYDSIIGLFNYSEYYQGIDFESETLDKDLSKDAKFCAN